MRSVWALGGFLCIVLSAFFASAGEVVYADNTYAVEVPNLADNEVLTGLKINIQSGAIEAVSGIPPGWTVNIINDPEWGDPKIGTKIDAEMAMGPMSKLELAKFQIRISSGGIKGAELKLSGTAEVATLPNMAMSKLVPLKSRDFLMVK
jgi:hypothetical protein